MSHRVDLALGPRSYAIHIEPGAAARADQVLADRLPPGRILVIADATVADLHAPALITALRRTGRTVELATFPAGEASKSLEQAEQLYQACAAARLDREGSIVALGGGVTGDLAGFVAATWMRGVALIQVPTSLLAMVDSSVGGKTGVNTAAGKNLVGAFWQPRAVLIDPDHLATMPLREYRSGLAEVLKHAVIRDAAFLAWQEAHATALLQRDPVVLAEAVAGNCRIKAWHVERDEHENGVRAHLNYGHTFGHALEREGGYRRYLHGEAVAIGMRMAAELSRRLGLLQEADLPARQDALLRAWGLPLVHPDPDPAACLIRLVAACGLDKKVRAGQRRFVLPLSAGTVQIVSDPDPAQVAEAFALGMVQGQPEPGSQAPKPR